MATATVDEAKLKDLLKTVLVEVLEERRDLLRDIVEEVIEDIALARAIEEGLHGETVARDEVFAILEGAQ
jgi:hypothetical protein